MSLLVRAGKAGKAFLKKYILPPAVHHVSYTRRLERVKTNRRICAMTFDDGPFNMPCSPDRFDGRTLTDVLLDTLAEFGAHGTFDVVGDTSENYPDKAGREGSPEWGGVKYDHYPDIEKDALGGAVHNERLIRRMIDEGHQISSHSYRHLIYGKMNYVYRGREFLGSLDAAVDDLKRLDLYMFDRYGYKITMHRPPHYVDKIGDGFTSYDVCDRMDYQYMAASFDGAGWLPLADYEAEVEAMVAPMKAALEKDPDFFCGQIIFQKDGYNMARRTPVADGLRKQLELLENFGYEVVSVEELCAETPFADVGQEDFDLGRFIEISKTRGIAFSDNTLRLSQPMTYGELAMLMVPKEEVLKQHMRAYPAAFSWAQKIGFVPANKKESDRVESLPMGIFGHTADFTRRSVYEAFRG